jgi:hypothetical protein
MKRTPENIMAEIRSRASIGLPLYFSGVPGALLHAAQRHCGSYRAAVEMAGLDYSKYMRKGTDTWRQNISKARTQPIKTPDHDSDYAYFLGVLLGDGCISERMRMVGCQAIDMDMIEAFMKCGEESFEITPSIHTIKRKTTAGNTVYWARFASTNMVKYLRNEISQGIPRWIFESDEETMCSFLSGFIDAEGYTSPKRCTVSVTQKKRITLVGIRYLLRKIGIYSNITTHSHNAFTLNILGRGDCAVYAQKIGFRITRKMDALRKSLAIVPKRNVHPQRNVRANHLVSQLEEERMMGLGVQT